MIQNNENSDNSDPESYTATFILQVALEYTVLLGLKRMRVQTDGG
jgi:hypothetical protein